MYAIILNKAIFARCENLDDVDAYKRDFPDSVSLPAPDDFVPELWIYEDGSIRKKTEYELSIEMATANVRSLRALEYPPFTDYLDGVVKGNQLQIQQYIDACLAVKAKYPKPQ
jgi:hypothetical protein